MAKRSRGPKEHAFNNKLLLNQWLISLFGINPLVEKRLNGKKALPFHVLADPIKRLTKDGLDADNLHHFYHALINSTFFFGSSPK